MDRVCPTDNPHKSIYIFVAGGKEIDEKVAFANQRVIESLFKKAPITISTKGVLATVKQFIKNIFS